MELCGDQRKASRKKSWAPRPVLVSHSNERAEYGEGR